MTIIATPTGEGLFTTYDELVAGIVGWLHRADLQPRIASFIALAEASINRIAQVRLMEHDVPLTLQAGARVIDLPINFTTPLGVWLADVQPRDQLSAALPEQLPVTDMPGRPSWWAVDGAQLAFNCPSDVDRPVVLRYRGGFRLTPDAPTNALLLKYPDLYLYGALLQSAPFIRDNDSLPLWREMYARCVQEVNATESRSRAAAPLRTEIAAVLGRCGNDFYQGYYGS